MPLVGNYPQSVMAIFGESSCLYNIHVKFSHPLTTKIRCKYLTKKKLPFPIHQPYVNSKATTFYIFIHNLPTLLLVPCT